MPILFPLLLVLIFSGCSTVQGPSVSSKEIQEATDELKIKSLEFRLDEIARVNRIGYRIAKTLPKEDIKVKPRPFAGLFCLARNKEIDKLFNIQLDPKVKKGLVVAFVLENTPAARAGVQKGDLLLAINKKDMAYFGKNFEYELKPNEKIILTVLRGKVSLDLPLSVDEMPVPVSFTVVDDQSVNAAAGPNQIFVTYGLLNFAKSDDEIAAVIGHELGHLSRGHVSRMQGGNIVSMITAIGLGIAAEAVSPGSGSTVMRGVGGLGDVFKAKFSRDLEREADYFGVKYVYDAGYDPEFCATVHERFAIEIPASMTRSYFSTHPSSPERKVRIQKIIEELKVGKTVTGVKS